MPNTQLKASDTLPQVQRVLWITLVLNIMVALAKIIIGTATNTLAIVADGFHSLTDSTGNVLGLIAIRFAYSPPDEHHPYGHQKFETLAAMMIGALLTLTAWETFKGILDRLGGAAAPETSPIVFGVLIFTFIVNLFVSRYELSQGKKLNSQILLADASHTASDVYVTLSVIVSTLIVSLTGWVWVDTLAALIVTLVIAKAAFEVLSASIGVLVDSAPYTPEEITQAVHGVAGVQSIIRARSRGSSGSASIDIDVRVPPEMTAAQTDAITRAIRERIQASFIGIVEVEVHFNSQDALPANPSLVARAYADARGLTTHEVQAIGDILAMHVEVDPDQSLAEAHEQVSLLEQDLQEHLPNFERIVTHIEPQSASPLQEDGEQKAQADELEKAAHDLLEAQYPLVNWHDFCTRATDAGMMISVHAGLPAEMRVSDAHQIAESAEIELRVTYPQLARVTIHTEPSESA